MYSRLYSRVLCLYRWFDSALATNLSFTDGGVFVLQGSAPPERLSHAVTVLVSELMMVANAVDPVELARARTQLKSSLMMNLESRIILMEDIGRQLVSSDKRLSAEELCNAIGPCPFFASCAHLFPRLHGSMAALLHLPFWEGRPPRPAEPKPHSPACRKRGSPDASRNQHPST